LEKMEGVMDSREEADCEEGYCYAPRGKVAAGVWVSITERS
jgi:hypothetical protein